MEPGGQLELSSAPAVTLGELIEVTGRDLAALRDAAAAAGLELCGYGLDPLRPPRRVLDLPRYAAMEKFFDQDGPWGRQMMCGTASVQVCLDAGDDGPGGSGYRSRWRLLHAIGPVLVAAFANSPLRRGRPTGWRSARQQVWATWTRAGPARPRPARGWRGPARRVDRLRPGRPADVRPRSVLRRLGRAARADLPRVGAGRRRGDAAGAHREDLDYHLSTLFPPVRPHGHLELRMIDAQPGDGWVVPAAVASALAGDERAADAALAATEPLWDGTGQCSGGDGPVAARGQVRAGRPVPQPGQPGSASRRPAPRWAASARPARSGGRWPTLPSSMYCKTDVRPTTNWRKSHDRASRGTA